MNNNNFHCQQKMYAEWLQKKSLRIVLYIGRVSVVWMPKMWESGLKVSEFELQSWYCVYFWTNALACYRLQSAKKYLCCSSTRMAFGIKWHSNVDMSLNKETKLHLSLYIISWNILSLNYLGCLVWFFGIATLEGYFMLNHFKHTHTHTHTHTYIYIYIYIYILDLWIVCR